MRRRKSETVQVSVQVPCVECRGPALIPKRDYDAEMAYVEAANAARGPVGRTGKPLEPIKPRDWYCDAPCFRKRRDRIAGCPENRPGPPADVIARGLAAIAAKRARASGTSTRAGGSK